MYRNVETSMNKYNLEDKKTLNKHHTYTPHEPYTSLHLIFAIGIVYYRS